MTAVILPLEPRSAKLEARSLGYKHLFSTLSSVSQFLRHLHVLQISSDSSLSRPLDELVSDLEKLSLQLKVMSRLLEISENLSNALVSTMKLSLTPVDRLKEPQGPGISSGQVSGSSSPPQWLG